MIHEGFIGAREVESLERLMAGAFQRALGSLSAMIGKNLDVVEFKLEELPLSDLSHMLGSPEAPALGVYVFFYGQGSCLVVLLLPPDSVSSLLELLLDRPCHDMMALDPLEASALAEVGNVMAGSFVGHMADMLGLGMPCAPPAVVCDMSGAMLGEAVFHGVIANDRVLMARSLFGEGQRSMAGVFLVVPSANLMSKMRERCLL